jgi:glycosyltransferase involved in cell wall biosynthesis
MNSSKIATIITSTMNCAPALACTAKSIRAQATSFIQWIIVDGGSSDSFLEVVRENDDIIDRWVSEPDDGIYDAWNKACKDIAGEWVIFLGAGDLLFSADTIEAVVAKLTAFPPTVMFAYGNVVQTTRSGERYRWGRVRLDEWDIYRPRLPAHQGIFHRAITLAGPYPFDSSYKIVADSKLLLPVMKEQNTRYIDIDICTMEPGGVSSNPASTLKVMREFLRLEVDVGYRIPRAKRLLFIARSYARFIIYRVAGQRAIDIATRLKNSLL